MSEERTDKEHLPEDLTPGAYFPADLMPPGREELLAMLKAYGFEAMGEKIKLMDTSHDAADIRLNYLIDHRFVLRISNGPDLTERRLAELNRLIGRYRDFGLRAPAFLPDGTGRFLHSFGPLSVYLAEYVDLPLVYGLLQENPGQIDGDALWQEVLDSVAGFAERYKNVDLSETRGMYSLFELSPFDREVGIDEKQQNFNTLMECLQELGEAELAARLLARHEAVRSRLRALYRNLPQCVFQADENFSNVLVGPDGHMAGFIDFNLAGTEVIVNQFANLGGGFQEEVKEPIGAAKRLEMTLQDYQKYQDRMLSLYQATEEEKEALGLYTWIALVAGWPQLCFFRAGLKNEALKEEILQLLWLLADTKYED